MKYFLDSAKLDEIDYAFEHWGIDGVTTNPRHIEASGLPFNEAVRAIADWAQKRELEGLDHFPISVEVNPHLDKADDMVTAAREIAKLSPCFVVKIPCTEPGLVAARRLEGEGIRTNVTLVFSPSQALGAARAGALFVSPFVGWKEASGEDCGEYIQSIIEIFAVQNMRSKVLVAALRSGKQIAEAATLGADIVTCGFDVYKQSYYHPFTDYGLGVFRASWDKIKHG